MPKRFQLLMLLLFVLVLHSYAFRRQKEYCSLLSKCNFSFPAEICPDSLRQGIEKVKYDSARCAESGRLIDAGVSTANFLGQKLFGFLGQKYRVEYPVVSALPIKESRFEYLLNDIPLAAKVVNAFQKTKYTAMYLDGERKRYWRGNNGRNLQGEANLIAGSIQERKLIYFGFGIVKILRWRLKGQVLFDYRYTVEEGKPISYDLKVLVFPGGAVVNAIMNMGLFKKVVRNKILEVFTDITDSANELSKMSYEELLEKYDWSEEDEEKLKELLAL